ncbi:hypothetical protein [Burkholderia gladioli]|uniref:hypothetical protein n=1 Tax=Burkholderia gladioli TaxID=28095 RepID=UPI0016420C10|nr:hypothetical protein [Burkholderia gladioli]
MKTERHAAISAALAPVFLVMTLYLAWPPIALAIDSKKDFIDVAAMLGTWAAVGAALYIALSDRYRRSANDLVIAKLTAASITYRLELLREATIRIHAIVIVRMGGDIYPSTFLVHVATLDSVAQCTFEELRCLAPLGENCALNIAASQDRIDIARNYLEKESLPLSDSAEQIRSLKIVANALATAEQLLTEAIGTCQRASGDIAQAHIEKPTTTN